MVLTKSLLTGPGSGSFSAISSRVDFIEVVEVGAEHARHMTHPARSGGYVLSGGGGEMPVHGEGLEVVADVDATYRVSTA